MSAPIRYYPDFVPDPDIAFAYLRDELDWERRADAPASRAWSRSAVSPSLFLTRS